MDRNEAYAAAAAAHQGLELAPGRSVLDGITGLNGRVVAGRVVHAIAAAPAAAASPSQLPMFKLPTAYTHTVYTVVLADDTVVERELADLMAYPAGLHTEVEEFEV